MTKYMKGCEVGAIDNLAEKIEAEVQRNAKYLEYSEESSRSFAMLLDLNVLVSSLKARLNELDDMYEKINKMYDRMMRG